MGSYSQTNEINLEKPLEFLGFLLFFFYITLTLEIPDKTTKLHHWKFCYTPWKFQGQKPRPLETPHNYFLITPPPVDNSIHFVLINLWKLFMLFLWSPWKFDILKPICSGFTWTWQPCWQLYRTLKIFSDFLSCYWKTKLLLQNINWLVY